MPDWSQGSEFPRRSDMARHTSTTGIPCQPPRMLGLACVVLIIGVAFCALAVAAELLPAPTKDVVLTVSGNIEHMNAPGAAHFDLAMLEALPSHGFVTRTPWTDSDVEFTGPLVRDVMRLVGARGTVVQAVALNDYKASIPMTDFDDYDVIIALTLNGQHMRIRDKGPLWVAYPLDEHPEIAESAPPKMVWQLKELVVE